MAKKPENKKAEEAQEGASRSKGSAEAQAEPQQRPAFQVINQFIRDMSFENIAAQRGAEGEIMPEVSVQVTLDAKQHRNPDHYILSTKYNVTSKQKGTDDALFLLELDYAGLFLIKNATKQQLSPLLLIECPRMLFPFVRRIVNDVTREGGFPPMNIGNVDFVALYRQQIERQKKAVQGGKPNGKAKKVAS